MNFEVGKLYKLKTIINPKWKYPIRFYNWATDEMEYIELGAILLYVDNEDFYKDNPRRFIFNNTFYSDSHNLSYSSDAELIFEEVI